jgi:osmotically-inducible protein OsmY
VNSVINRIVVRYPTAPALPSDAEIKTHVQNALLFDPNIFSFKIDVGVKDGWVTLKGTVDAFWKKIEAEETADRVRGVIGVTNELAVVPTEKAGDEMIAKNVVKALERNINVNVDDITVTVKNGVVTLTGTVPSYIAKWSAYNSAFYTAGVVSVDDQTFVRYFLEPDL